MTDNDQEPNTLVGTNQKTLLDHKSRTSSERMTFWFPVVLPVLMGLLLAFAELTVDFATTSISKDQMWLDFLRADITKLWAGVSKGVASSVFAVDIWALTMLYTSRREGEEAASFAYGYPVLGIFVHFILLLMVVGFTTLADGLATDELLRSTISTSEDELSYGVWSILMRVLATVCMFASVIVAWAVRRAIWIYHERLRRDTT